MIRGVVVAALFLLSLGAGAQKVPMKSLTIGLEQDALPYATGGYFAGAWVGKGHVRGRALLAHVHKPDLITPEGFTNNRVTAYALVGDYFLKPGWKGWYAGTGLVLWKSNIQSNIKAGVAYYRNWLWNGSVGYNITLHKNLYLSPWAGMHVRVGGDKSVLIDGKTFTPPLLNPEASVKVGVFF